MTSNECYITGQEMLQQVDGHDGEAVVDSLQDITPDFACYPIELPFGSIYAGPGLDLRSREIAAIAVLTALGSAAPQLKVHIATELNVGLAQEGITEVTVQMAVYTSLPVALNGLLVVKTVFAMY